MPLIINLMRPLARNLAIGFALISALYLFAAPVDAEEVNVYSYRKPHLIKPMFDAFSAETGIKVNAVFAKKGMLERIRIEGINSPVDVVLTVDIGRLSDVKNAGLTQPVHSSKILQNIPADVRDPENHWFGLTARARILVTAKDRVAPGLITRYEDLAEPILKGRVCMRSGKHPYNIALVASMIQKHGHAAAQKWLEGLKANLARTPQGNDRSQVKAIAEGVCDVAIINHYYMYQMTQNHEQKAWVDTVDSVFPNQNDRGTHINISGMTLAKYAPHRANATRLMVFLASVRAQKMYAEVNGEYPVSEAVETSAYLKSLGTFKRDTVALAKVAAKRTLASKLVDRVDFNN